MLSCKCSWDPQQDHKLRGMVENSTLCTAQQLDAHYARSLRSHGSEKVASVWLNQDEVALVNMLGIQSISSKADAQG